MYFPNMRVFYVGASPPQGHFSTCAFNVIPCPNRCSVKLTRRDLPDHLQHDCPKRKVKCEFCGSEFTGEAYEVNADSKPVFTIFLSCGNSAGARRKQLRVMPHHFHVHVKELSV